MQPPRQRFASCRAYGMYDRQYHANALIWQMTKTSVSSGLCSCGGAAHASDEMVGRFAGGAPPPPTPNKLVSTLEMILLDFATIVSDF